MDGQLLKNEPSKTYGEIFDEACPYYMSIGMTYEQFWDGEACMAVFFREASEITNERLNSQMWLQGMYIYDILARMSPILVAHPRKNAKPKPYVEKPYPLKGEPKQEESINKGLAFFQNFVATHNKKFIDK